MKIEHINEQTASTPNQLAKLTIGKTLLNELEKKGTKLPTRNIEVSIFPVDRRQTSYSEPELEDFITSELPDMAILVALRREDYRWAVDFSMQMQKKHGLLSITEERPLLARIVSGLRHQIEPHGAVLFFGHKFTEEMDSLNKK